MRAQKEATEYRRQISNTESRKPKAESRKPKAESRKRNPYLPNPADCIDCREISAVDAMPCMRSLKSSALEAFSSAVS